MNAIQELIQENNDLNHEMTRIQDVILQIQEIYYNAREDPDKDPWSTIESMHELLDTIDHDAIAARIMQSRE